MKKLLNTAILFFVCSALMGVNCFGQVSFEDLANPPRTGAEAMKYLDKYIKPKINDTLIARLFAEADLVFEGEIVEVKTLIDTRQNIYYAEPYKIFKGGLCKDSTLKILTYPAPLDVQYLGEWSHGRGIALFFVKKDPQNENIYRFVNPKNAWIGYAGRFISPLTFEKQYKMLLYDKILGEKGAKYEKTKFYYKKKENIDVGSVAMRGDNYTITGFSRDTVPAGIRATDASYVTIYGNGFGAVKGNVLLEDANQANVFVALHPAHNILYWSDDSIQIIVPSMGFASATDETIGDTRNSCPGTGYVRVVPGTGLPFPIWSETELVVPYAITNHATNSAFESLYTAHEVHLRNANGQGGYTFVYETSFYNNTAALTAFRRALKTWRCTTGIHFKELCGENTFCKTDESSTRVLVSFAKNCFPASGTTVLATTTVVPKLDPNCPQFFTDSIRLAFRPQNELIYNCGPGTATCPAVWNYDTLDNATPNAYNFEKVATHELGHVLLLQHVIDSTSLMHYNTQTGSETGANLKTPDAYTLQGMEYILGRDTAPSSGCGAAPLVLLSATDRCGNLPGSGKTDDIQDETPCFVDLRMRDNAWDTGQEPNYSAGVDVDGGGWSPTSPNDWEDIWYSPDLWNCDEEENCPPSELHNPRATVINKMGFTIYNAHPDIISDSAKLHLYYSLANTGEMWDSDWLNNTYPNGLPGQLCRVGNEIPSSSVTIPPIDPQTYYTNWVTWSPPNFVNADYPFYAAPGACGLITETDPADGQPKYEICLLARLQSAQDPIVGETEDIPIRDNVLNSNNIVTRNAFLIDPALGPGGGMPPFTPGHPSVILVANSNDEVRNLDIRFDKFTAGSFAALSDILEISFVLSPELWDKWESTGKQGEGIEEIDTREVKITNMETAKLLNIPFDPREFQPLAIKVTILTSSGKRETLNYLPDEFGFRITHRSSDGSPINKPSNCLFMVKDISNQVQASQTLSETLICSPNPFSGSMNVQFYLAKEETVTLALYDLQGRLVKTVLAIQNLTQGKHIFSLDSNGLANGVYICSLITSTKLVDEKVVLVR